MQTDTKPNLVAAWFGTAFITLFFSLTLLIFLSFDRIVYPVAHDFKLYAALPKQISQTSDNIKSEDARSKIVENFFNGYKSLLADYGKLFIEVADKYKLDFRLLPAISMQESNGGKKVIEGSHNPFGYGIYENSVIKFASWEEAIESVAKGLRQNYLDKGLNSPAQIMAKYTPPSSASGGSWAKGVSSFMTELR